MQLDEDFLRALSTAPRRWGPGDGHRPAGHAAHRPPIRRRSCSRWCGRWADGAAGGTRS
jgi:hypothetical protein